MMNKTFVTIFVVIAGLGLAIGDVSWVYAQETEEFTLEEIVVTAQKREEDQQKVAVTMETISGEELADMGRTNLWDALSNIPGITVQGMAGSFVPVIRGMDNDSMPHESFSMVATVVDGVYVESFLTSQTGLFDMKRIEALSGPQGTLFGRNSPGGVVSIVSNDPTAEKFEGAGSFGMGNYSLINVQGMVNAPVNDKLAIRASFSGVVRDGYIRNGSEDDDTKSLRLKLGYYPTGVLSTVFGFEFTRLGGIGPAMGANGFEREDDVEDPWANTTAPIDLYRTNYKYQKGYVNLNWSTPIGELTFLPAVMYTATKEENESTVRNADGSSYYEQGYRNTNQKEMSGELRMSSSEDSFMKWLIGLYYYNMQWVTSEWSVSRAWSGRSMENPSLAAFGNFTYPVSEKFRVTVGGRYTKDKEIRKSEGASQGPPGMQTSSNDQRYRSSHFDYKLGVEYDLGENSMLWAEHSTGYKHVMRNALSQTLKSYQLGTKNRFFDEKLQLNYTAWYYDYTNYSVNTSRTYWWEGVEYTARGTGIGSAILYGIDLSTNFILTNKDRIDFSFSGLHSEVSDLVITYDYYYPPSEEFNGLPFNRSPEYTITAGYEHRFDLASGGSITASFTTRYETETFIEFFLADSQVPAGMDKDLLNTEPDNHMSEASLNYSSPSGKWSLNSYVKNIENHAKKVGLMRGDLRLSAPRTYGAILTVKF